jgi:hypothetical protein
MKDYYVQKNVLLRNRIKKVTAKIESKNIGTAFLAFSSPD